MDPDPESPKHPDPHHCLKPSAHVPTESTKFIFFIWWPSPFKFFHVQFKNQFRGLDDDEVDFLDRVDDMRTEAEKVLF